MNGLVPHLATGHDEQGQVAKNWDYRALAGCGALRSTANDMQDFLAANLETVESPLASAIQNTHQRRRDIPGSGLSVGLGWPVQNRHGTEILWHNGGSYGYHCFAGFDKQQRIGVVILLNADRDIDDIGYHLLNPRYELKVHGPPPDTTSGT